MPTALGVHGGAWNIPDDAVQPSLDGVRQAVELGWRLLSQGASALDTVEQVVRLLEDDPIFDAGRGSRLNRNREVEMDASIMDGARLDVGAVAAIQRVPNPITVARHVLDHSPHALLVGEGAHDFATARGLPTCETRDLLVGRELDRYLRVRGGERELVEREFDPDGGAAAPQDDADASEPSGPMGTVGAVALDHAGNLAAATSTGGTQDKAPGRVGDTPIPGAGTYADNRAGAASATGWGEGILRVCLTKTAVDALAAGDDAARAGARALQDLSRVSGHGGVIIVDRGGNVAATFNTPRMARAFASDDRGVHWAIEREQP